MDIRIKRYLREFLLSEEILDIAIELYEKDKVFRVAVTHSFKKKMNLPDALILVYTRYRKDFNKLKNNLNDLILRKNSTKI